MASFSCHVARVTKRRRLERIVGRQLYPKLARVPPAALQPEDGVASEPEPPARSLRSREYAASRPRSITVNCPNATARTKHGADGVNGQSEASEAAQYCLNRVRDVSTKLSHAPERHDRAL